MKIIPQNEDSLNVICMSFQNEVMTWTVENVYAFCMAKEMIEFLKSKTILFYHAL